MTATDRPGPGIPERGDAATSRPLKADDPDAEVVFTRGELDELAEIDRRNRSTRTGAQAGLGASAIILADYVLNGFLNIDLNPRDANSVEFPVTVTGALLVVGAWAVSKWMNRRPPARR